MTLFRELALAAITQPRSGVGTSGSYNFLPQFASRYIDDLVNSWLPRFDGLPRLKVAVETGNGTTGLSVQALFSGGGVFRDPGEGVAGLLFLYFNPNLQSKPHLKSAA